MCMKESALHELQLVGCSEILATLTPLDGNSVHLYCGMFFFLNNITSQSLLAKLHGNKTAQILTPHSIYFLKRFNCKQKGKAGHFSETGCNISLRNMLHL